MALWAYEVTLESGKTLRVGEWLKTQDEKICRAFLERWTSYTEPPLWWKVTRKGV